ncbi:hypothetical protein NDU88_002706 [Pleurodeles waltl]|uniref:Uncharacterized protein n=1 Tax=Pleurodeles waltl TaxID=8319 RepID=A0AAV7RB34_PLEWA|nr:hypothetical protein NDU88_002706 [Pleurodeles waltl]
MSSALLGQIPALCLNQQAMLGCHLIPWPSVGFRCYLWCGPRSSGPRLELRSTGLSLLHVEKDHHHQPPLVLLWLQAAAFSAQFSSVLGPPSQLQGAPIRWPVPTSAALRCVPGPRPVPLRGAAAPGPICSPSLFFRGYSAAPRWAIHRRLLGSSSAAPLSQRGVALLFRCQRGSGGAPLLRINARPRWSTRITRPTSWLS